MSEAHVNLHLRNDVIGDVLRQKETLDRVSEVLCDGLGDFPGGWWEKRSQDARTAGLMTLAERLQMIADLVAETNL